MLIQWCFIHELMCIIKFIMYMFIFDIFASNRILSHKIEPLNGIKRF